MNAMRTRRAFGAVLVATVALPLALLTGAPAHATVRRAETTYRRTIAVAR